MRIKIWGSRGSLPTPLTNTLLRAKLANAVRQALKAGVAAEGVDAFLESLPYSQRSTYGGNTSCIEVRSRDDKLFILDCGTGLRMLGEELMQREFGAGKGHAYIYISHTHWDHIQGLPFFYPIYVKGNHFTILSPAFKIEERLRYQHNPFHFPVAFSDFKAKIEFINLEPEGTTEIAGVKLITKRMIHPNNSYGLRMEEAGRSFVYSSDTEFNLRVLDSLDAFVHFFKDADVVVFDSQYSFEDQLNKIDWGHSSGTIVVDVAMQAGVKKVMLNHHDPSYDDEKIDLLAERTREYHRLVAGGQADAMQILTAYDGLTMEI